MADANPVSRGQPKRPDPVYHAPPYVDPPLEQKADESEKDYEARKAVYLKGYSKREADHAAEFKAKVDALVAGSVPALILDKQLTQIGSERNYGHLLVADVLVQDIHNKDGEVIKQHTCLRVTH